MTSSLLDFDALTARVLRGDTLSPAEGLAVLNVPDTDTLKLVEAAWRVQCGTFADTVKVNVLLNAKSGLCAEDCAYCSQARGADTGMVPAGAGAVAPHRRPRKYGPRPGGSCTCAACNRWRC